MDINITAAKNKVQQKGFLDIEVDPTIDLFYEIEKLKKNHQKEKQSLEEEIKFISKNG